MKESELKGRVDALLARINEPVEGESLVSVKSLELFQGVTTLLVAVYGNNSVQVANFLRERDTIRLSYNDSQRAYTVIRICAGVLQNLKAELEAGLTGNLQRTITGEVLTDFIQLARTALEEKGDEAKKVAAVLAASVYEDTIRRLALTNGIPHTVKLADVLTALKDNGLLQGSQVGIANSYLNFRNNALHAQWDKVERESVASVLGFVEQLLLKHF